MSVDMQHVSAVQLLDITRLGHRKRILASLKPSIANGLTSSQEPADLASLQQNAVDDAAQLSQHGMVGV